MVPRWGQVLLAVILLVVKITLIHYFSTGDNDGLEMEGNYTQMMEGNYTQMMEGNYTQH